MIKEIWVQNFKSLTGDGDDGFSLKLDKITYLIGLNGSGKTTILQFLDFVRHIALGNVSAWLIERNWKASELNFFAIGKIKTLRKKNILFKITVEIEGKNVVWDAEFNRDRLYLVSERISVGDDILLKVDKREYVIGERKSEIDFSYEGSILSVLKDKVLPGIVLSLKNILVGIMSREFLSPPMLRKSSRGTPKDIGRYGERLSAYADSVGSYERIMAAETIKPLFPSLQGFAAISKKAGWKDLYIIEDRLDARVVYTTRHASDGLLRMLAVVFDISSPNTFIMLEEIENGISPEVMEKIVGLLAHAKSQIVVTTHSPILLNYISNEDARKSVVFLYKTSNGYTRAIPLFSDPEMASRLNVMGPGEAVLDVSLQKLADRLSTAEEMPEEAKL